MKRNYLTSTELKLELKKAGLKVRPSYCHDDYLFTSVTMPYTTKAKLDSLQKYLGCTRSNLVATLIERAHDRYMSGHKLTE